VFCVLFECGVLFCVMCVICVLCLIVLPLPPGKNPFPLKINNNKIFLLSLMGNVSVVVRVVSKESRRLVLFRISYIIYSYHLYLS
jgi:hypothetical protein